MSSALAKPQFCDYCGEPLGTFVHHRIDGPLTCGASECERWARDAARYERQCAAEDDDYGRY